MVRGRTAAWSGGVVGGPNIEFPPKRSYLEFVEIRTKPTQTNGDEKNINRHKLGRKISKTAKLHYIANQTSTIRNISKSAFTHYLSFGILIAKTEFVDEAPNSINCFKVIHGYFFGS